MGVRVQTPKCPLYCRNNQKLYENMTIFNALPYPPSKTLKKFFQATSLGVCVDGVFLRLEGLSLLQRKWILSSLWNPVGERTSGLVF